MSNHLKTIGFLLLILSPFFQTKSYSQTSDYNLLWQINGPNLETPSYLYGTMHLNDERIFRFPDSLWLAIEACDQFAVEIDLNSSSADICNYISETMGDAGGKEDMPMPKEENRMATIMDAYLMQYAKSKGKRIVGLENLADQLEHLNYYEEDFEMTEAILEEYVQLYRAGNLEKLVNPVENAAFLEDPIMLKRNQVMAHGIDSILQQNSLFSAVGAAHLIGKGNVVDLLRQKGYSLRPVTAKFSNKKLPRRILSKQDWVNYESSKLGVAADFPVAPCSMKKDGLELLMSLDFGTGLFYMVLPVRVPGLQDEATIEELYKEVLEGTGKIRSSQDIIYQGIKGIEALIEEEESFYYYYRLLYHNDILYMLSVFAFCQDDLKKLSRPFLNSVRFIEPQQVESAATTDGYLYQSDGAGYQVQFPYKPFPNSVNTASPLAGKLRGISLHQQIGMAPDNNAFYATQYFVLPQDLYNQDLEGFVEQNYANFVTTAGGEENILQFDTVRFGDYLCTEAIAFQNGRHNTARTIYRGNKIYQQLIMHPEAMSFSDPFFESFEFLPFQVEEWQTRKVPEDGFQIDFPAMQFVELDTSFQRSTEETSRNNVYIAKDTLSGMMALVEYYNYSLFEPYAYPQDTLYEALKPLLVDSTDVVVKNKRDSLDGVIRYSLISKDRLGILKSRHEIYANENGLYRVQLVYPEELENAGRVADFFNSFKITDPDFYTKKDYGAIGLRYLESTDTFLQQKALNSLENIPFEKKHLDELQALYLGNRIPESYAQAFFEAYLRAGKEQAVDFLVTQVEAGKPKESILIEMLQAIRNYDIEQDTEHLLTLLPKAPISQEGLDNGSLMASIGIDTDYFIDHYDQLHALGQQQQFRTDFLKAARFFSYYVEEDQKSFGKSKLPDFNALLEQVYAEEKQANLDEYRKANLNNQVWLLLEVLDNFGPDTNGFELIKQAFGPELNDNCQLAIESCIRHSEPIEVQYVSLALTDSLNAYAVHRWLKDTEQLEPYTKQGLKIDEQFIALSDLASLMYDYEYIEPDAIVFRGTKDLTLKGQRGTIYIFEFTVTYEGESTSYLGISGPFPMQHDSETGYNYLTDYSGTPFDGSKEAIILKEILERYEELEGY